ncbi:MAG TPA: ABC transporter substrate-binding protein [Micromonospora sp.]
MSLMDRRQMLKLMASLGAAGLTGACGWGEGDDEAERSEPIKIGLIAPQTGGYKPIGEEMINGFQLYLDLTNHRLGGHPVDVIVEDEGDSAQSGRAAFERLIKEDVLAITGVASSEVMLSIRDAVEQARVPLLGSNASPRNLQGVLYIWRTSYINDEPGRAMGTFVKRQLRRSERVSLSALDYTGGRDSIQGFLDAFGSDSRLSLPVVWAPFTTNPPRGAFRATVQQLLAQDPQAIYCFYAGAAAIEFLRELRSAGYRGRIYGPGFLTEGSVLDALGELAEGVMTAMNYSADLDNAINMRFATNYRKKHGSSPTTYAMASFDAALVLDRAIRLTKNDLTPQQLNLALGKIGLIESPRGTWYFNQSRTPQQSWYLREVRHDGTTFGNVTISELTTLG